MIAPPRLQKTGFHVKHTPIQETSSDARPLIYQLVYLGIDDLNRDPVCERRYAALFFPIHSDAKGLVPLYANSHRHFPVARRN
jgi:hypothetical protein